MKTFTLTIAFSLLTILGFSQDETGATVTVTIDQIKNNNGHILLGLHTTETFMRAAATQSVKSEIVDGKIVATFTNVQPGSYAVMVVHDENDNEKMDFEPNGMPKETYGMSNNPTLMGPPQFNDAKFEVADKDLEFDIELM
ncbi:MAG: DUF2141 domain-containing protein [Aquaticitalea sp.]